MNKIKSCKLFFFQTTNENVNFISPEKSESKLSILILLKWCGYTPVAPCETLYVQSIEQGSQIFGSQPTFRSPWSNVKILTSN